METLKSSIILFLLGIVLLIGSFALDSYIYLTGSTGLIGDVQWISHILGIVLVILGYRSK
ncbi:MAG: hypothetical protein ACW99U_13955 [Candidatus Thorarchaeota archaeon]